MFLCSLSIAGPSNPYTASSNRVPTPDLRFDPARSVTEIKIEQSWQVPQIRVSAGSAIVLGLLKGKLDAKPTTIYLLTYKQGKCLANCGFCPQARMSRGRADMLARVTWPVFPTGQVLSRIEVAAKTGMIQRVCIQALNYPGVFQDVMSLAETIKSRAKVPLSVSCQPLDRGKLEKLAQVGVDRISIALDAATNALFEKIKGTQAGGTYHWEKQREALMNAVQTFGKNNVTTHLIVGLGESEQEMVQTIQWSVDCGVYPGLFAFTPIPGTVMENQPKPSVQRYRRIQVARYLITRKATRVETMRFSSDGSLTDFGVTPKKLLATIKTGVPFVTSGCPGCNRPYYNESPGGLIYNYPIRPPRDVIETIVNQFKQFMT